MPRHGAAALDLQGRAVPRLPVPGARGEGGEAPDDPDEAPPLPMKKLIVIAGCLALAGCIPKIGRYEVCYQQTCDDTDYYEAKGNCIAFVGRVWGKTNACGTFAITEN